LLFLRINSVPITGRAKKSNSAEIEQMLIRVGKHTVVWWALDQAAVAEAKSICLHRSYGQTLSSEAFFAVHVTVNLFL